MTWAAWRDLKTAIAGDDPPLVLPRGRRMRRLVGVLPALTGLLTFIITLATAADLQARSNLWFLLATLAGVLPLALVPRRTLLAWRICIAAALMTALMDGWNTGPHSVFPWHPGQLIVLIFVLFAIGFRHQFGVLLWIFGLSGLLMVLFVAPTSRIGMVLLVAALLAVPYLASRRVAIQQRLDREQERSALLTERARIARELHDVVAHHMSMIAVRAETAPYRLDGLPEAARREFVDIADAARLSLTETRRLLGVLRSEGDEAAPTAPQPGLGDLVALVEAARSAGSEVSLETRGDLTEVAPGVDVSGYRIVQEALSNAARHAAGARVRVAVQRVEDRVDIRVVNGAGQPAGGKERGGTGHGLRGMRERVSMLDGQLIAMPTGDGGFEVHAVLPTDGGRAG